MLLNSLKENKSKNRKYSGKHSIIPLFVLPICLLGCSSNACVITESTFFLVMTNIQYFPEEYIDKTIDVDCFTYSVKDVNEKEYICGVRKCTAGFGCKCGKDTVIGFILNYEGNIPEPINQYEDTNEKSWIHITGQLTSIDKTSIDIYSSDNVVETIEFLSFDVTSLQEITDYSKLAYFVS